jgi:hypothetical protein
MVKAAYHSEAKLQPSTCCPLRRHGDVGAQSAALHAAGVDLADGI